MAISITLDSRAVNNKLSQIAGNSLGAALRASSDIANEVLRLSQREVPHDLGSLQNSGHVEPEPMGHIIGYNKVYAARLHEHPEYRFGKGRKGKYLEDPIKFNTDIFIEYVIQAMRGIL